MDNKPTFKHDFKTILGIVDIQGINGYTKCLKALYDFLAEETKFNPDNRYIDSVKLLDRITNTNEELSDLLSQEILSIKDDISNVL